MTRLAERPVVSRACRMRFSSSWLHVHIHVMLVRTNDSVSILGSIVESEQARKCAANYINYSWRVSWWRLMPSPMCRRADSRVCLNCLKHALAPGGQQRAACRRPRQENLVVY